MREACGHFVGTHDFEAFKGRLDERENTVRTIFACGIQRRGPLVVFAVEGSGFLYHMVRTMVGTVLNVGTGYWNASHVPDVIASRDRKMSGPCAPAVGLHLQWIRF
jgi:tRNA pseudouridine38-40 synthase